MLKYVVKRVFLAIITLLIICAITFFAMNAIPGGPFDGEKAISEEVRAALERRYNLDKPVPEQFVLYMKNLLQGDFGISLKTGREIKTVIGESFVVSAKLGGMAVVVAVILGVIFGSIAALTRNHLPDRLIIFFSTLLTSLPSFVLGTLLLLVFCVQLGWIPVWGVNNRTISFPVISAGSLPDGVHYPSYQDQHAGRYGTGLCAYGESEGRIPLEGNLQAYSAKCADSGHHLRGTDDGIHSDRFPCCGENLHHWRTRREIRRRHH